MKYPDPILLGILSIALAAHGEAQTCSGNIIITVAAVPSAGSPSTATASFPWPEAPATPGVHLKVVQESNGEVLGDTDENATAVSPKLIAADSDRSANVSLSIDMLRTPLGGAKLVQMSWRSGETAKTACFRIRLAAAPVSDATTSWVVNGTPVDRLPGGGTLGLGDRVEVRVSAPGLWRDTRLELDQRLLDQLVVSVGAARLTPGAGGAVASFPITVRAPYQAQGARYAALLRSEGWSEPAPLAPVPVRGEAPRFLPNPEGSGEYSIAASAVAPTVTLQGTNLGLAGEEAQLRVRVRAFNGADAQIDERAPLTKTLGACATLSRQCLTLTLEKPSPAARRYEVVLTSADSQTTANPARVKAKADVFTLSKVESRFADQNVVFAGQRAILQTTVDTNAGGQLPSVVRIDGQVVSDWTANLAASTLTLTGVAIPALDENIDRAQMVLTLEFPNGNSAVGALTALQVPVIADTPIRIYGGREQTVTVGGRYLSDVSLLPGNVVTPTQVTVGANRLSLTLGTVDAAPAKESLTVRRAGQPLPLTIPVEVVNRPEIASAVSLGTTRTQDCPATGGVPFSSAQRVVVPAGGSLCVRIKPDSTVAAGVKDSVQVKVSYEGTTVGTPAVIIYNARLGVPGALISLAGVEPGSAVDVTLSRADQRSNARAVTSIRQRIGLLATITGAQIRPFLGSKGKNADEELIPTNINTALNVGVGVFLRPLNNRYLTAFAGATQSTRSFCQGSARAATVNQPALFAGLSFRWIALGLGGAIRPGKIPDSCVAPAAGTTATTVSDRGGVWFFLGPAITLSH